MFNLHLDSWLKKFRQEKHLISSFTPTFNQILINKSYIYVLGRGNKKPNPTNLRLECLHFKLKLKRKRERKKCRKRETCHKTMATVSLAYNVEVIKANGAEQSSSGSPSFMYPPPSFFHFLNQLNIVMSSVWLIS